MHNFNSTRRFNIFYRKIHIVNSCFKKKELLVECYETTPKEIHDDTSKPASKQSFDTSKENYWRKNKTKTQENSAYKTAAELFLTFSLLSPLSLPPSLTLLHTQDFHTLRALRHLLLFPFLTQIFRSICFSFLPLLIPSDMASFTASSVSLSSAFCSFNHKQVRFFAQTVTFHFFLVLLCSFSFLEDLFFKIWVFFGKEMIFLMDRELQNSSIVNLYCLLLCFFVMC